MEPSPVQMEPLKIESAGIKSYNSNNIDFSKSAAALKAKQMSWASIASQPVKLPPKSLKSKLATAVLSATKHVPPSVPPSSSPLPPPSSVTEEHETNNGVDVHSSSGNHDLSEPNGSRDNHHRPSQPTPEPTPAQAAEIIERQKKEQSQQNRDHANLKNTRRDARNESKAITNYHNDQFEAAKNADSCRFSSKSSLNSSINSHRSNQDETCPVQAPRERAQPNDQPREYVREIRLIRPVDASQEHGREPRDYPRRETRDYSQGNRHSRDVPQDHRDLRDNRDFSRDLGNARYSRDYYARGDNNRRHDTNNGRWDEQSIGRDNSRDRREPRDHFNRPEYRDYRENRDGRDIRENRDHRDNRRDQYANRNNGKHYNDDSNPPAYGGSRGQGPASYHSYHTNHPSAPGRPMYGKQMARSTGNGSMSHRQLNMPHRSGGPSGGRVVVKPTGTITHSFPPLTEHQQQMNEQEAQCLLDKLRSENNYNPSKLDTPSKSSRFFIIKSYSEDDVHRSIKYSIWCSTEHGNAKLDAAYRSQETLGPVYLLYSVNGSGHFCGVAQMLSPVDYQASSGVWSQDKWKGQFRVKWIYVKDVPNQALKHIILANNEYKPVTYSRDTQEVPHTQGCEVLDIIHSFSHHTSIFDDFLHYEKKQLEEQHYRQMQQEATSSSINTLSSPPPPSSGQASSSSSGRDYESRHHSDRSYSHNARTIERPHFNRSNESDNLVAAESHQDTTEDDVNGDQRGGAGEGNGSGSPVESKSSDSITRNDDSTANQSEPLDSELAGACFKLNLQSTVWADQWD
jgi:hypothetical protein